MSQTKERRAARKRQIIEILKFTGFSVSAGVIQFVSTGVLSTWTSLIPYYWVAYLIGLVLSVIWNFTLNRKFTFRSASNLPLAMTLVIIYYCAFTPLSTFGADAINAAWKTAAGESWKENYELVITASMMILNFVTEFLWDKFIVFNDKVINKLLRKFKKEKSVSDADKEIPTKNTDHWFTVEKIDDGTYVISEYRHPEETHCYLLIGCERCLLIDTGLGICNIYEQVRKLTDKPVTAVATHIHWDHIGGHKYFPDFYAHEAELDWLNGKFPLSIQTVRDALTDRCVLPEGFDVNAYSVFQGTPTKILHGGETIDLGDRKIKVLHTAGHSPGHLCFWEEERGYVFTGDLIYKDMLFADYTSTDPEAYLQSLERIAALPAKRLFPAHHSLDIKPEIAVGMRDAFRDLKTQGKLRHGAGTFDYGDWSVRL